MKKNQYADNPIIIWQQQGAKVDGSTARHSKSHAFSNPGRPDHRSRAYCIAKVLIYCLHE
jgi:hypothetical protein